MQSGHSAETQRAGRRLPSSLQGRMPEIARIEKALFAVGRHIFINGDRGVGKSALAAAAASLSQSADAYRK